MDGTFSFTSGEALECTPTKTLRAEVEEAGEPLPTAEQLEPIARVFVEALEHMRIKLISLKPCILTFRNEESILKLCKPV